MAGNKNSGEIRAIIMIWTVLGFILGFIGAVSSIWFLLEKLTRRVKLRWRFVEKSVKAIGHKLTGDDFSPTLIVGIGRGGAIVGAMLSGVLGHRPLFVIDRKYEWKGGRRIDGIFESLRISLGLEKVLLVAGEVHTGNTMKLYYDYFKKIGANEIRRATLYYEKGATEYVEYKGFESSKKNLHMPWMITKEYRRQSLSEDEAKGYL